MMEARAQFFFDYVDPASYVLERWVRDLEAEVGHALAERQALEVNPPPAPLLDPTSSAWTSRWSEARARAGADGTDLVVPGLRPWTRKAHELACHARGKGVFAQVHQALFRAFHAGGRDIGRVDVLGVLAREHALSASETRAVLDVDKHAPEVEASTARARTRGVTGVPTLVTRDVRREDPPDRASVRHLLDP